MLSEEQRKTAREPITRDEVEKGRFENRVHFKQSSARLCCRESSAQDLDLVDEAPANELFHLLNLIDWHIVMRAVDSGPSRFRASCVRGRRRAYIALGGLNLCATCECVRRLLRTA